MERSIAEFDEVFVHLPIVWSHWLSHNLHKIHCLTFPTPLRIRSPYLMPSYRVSRFTMFINQNQIVESQETVSESVVYAVSLN